MIKISLSQNRVKYFVLLGSGNGVTYELIDVLTFHHDVVTFLEAASQKMIKPVPEMWRV
jgi:hypothetical protein